MAAEKAKALGTSQVAVAFQNSKLPTGELKAGLLPGIGEASIKKLKANSVDSCDSVYATYFSLHRDEDAFSHMLEACGIETKYAKECAYCIHRKLGPAAL